MKLSYAWLSEYVAHGLSPEALAEALTLAGLEVEDVERQGPALDGVVVGHVLDVRRHPDADRLSLCTVDLGDGGDPVQIVCGAPNVAAGQKVPVATVGTTLLLPSKEEGGARTPVTIKRAKVRGEESNGMICAEDELGIGPSHAGILVLDEGAAPGEPFAAYLDARGQRPGDAVLDVNVTPNRPDATSHLGVARDVAALTGRPLCPPHPEPLALVETGEASGEAEGGAFRVSIADPAACGRYVGVLIRGVRVGPSPEGLRARLEAIGLRPINNVVDATNFVLHEMGQPLHAFDFQKLAGAELAVRDSTPGETLTTLDGAERTLPVGTLVIADGERAVAVAGVMGSANSEVSDATTDVLLESAYFAPNRVRRASKKLGLSTDAAYRFERGVDPTAQALAAARAARLIVELAGGAIGPGLDVHPAPVVPRVVALRPGRLARVLGVRVPEHEAVGLLRAIGFEVEERPLLDVFDEHTGGGDGASETALRCTVPPFRPDVEREIDLIEEVARLRGFERIPEPASASVPLAPPAEHAPARLFDTLRDRLVGLGFREIFSNSLLPRETADRVAARPEAAVETLNPISQEMAALRPSLVPGLLTALAHNARRGAPDLRLFEVGHVFERGEDAHAPVSGYRERTHLTLALTGAAVPAAWGEGGRRADFFDLKGVVEHLLAGLGLPPVDETVRPEGDGVAAYRLDLAVADTPLGSVFRVSDALAARFDGVGEAFVAVLDADALAGLLADRPPVRVAAVPRFPAVERDLAVVVEERTPVGPMLATLRQTGGDGLLGVRVFDVYRGERVAAGAKSVAFALRFGADRTLTDREVDGRMRALVGALERGHGATLRQ